MFNNSKTHIFQVDKVTWSGTLYWYLVTDLDLRTGTGTTGYLRTESEPRKKWSSLNIKNFNLDLFQKTKRNHLYQKGLHYVMMTIFWE